ncbi:hypothetical protein SKAU_G00384300 [Synaphobranchus kaupii]|uniref:Uncharacterized protein n=1 Tax=Synaphobranchus kaupii TaxID=118154 RepID=A0A9Q1EED2_SYNKA|nr:hypothetical protein SKAU_G00384300 [Synaphobranchus kaupii]
MRNTVAKLKWVTWEVQTTAQEPKKAADPNLRLLLCRGARSRPICLRGFHKRVALQEVANKLAFGVHGRQVDIHHQSAGATRNQAFAPDANVVDSPVTSSKVPCAAIDPLRRWCTLSPGREALSRVATESKNASSRPEPPQKSLRSADPGFGGGGRGCRAWATFRQGSAHRSAQRFPRSGKQPFPSIRERRDGVWSGGTGRGAERRGVERSRRQVWGRNGNGTPLRKWAESRCDRYC